MNLALAIEPTCAPTSAGVYPMSRVMKGRNGKGAVVQMALAKRSTCKGTVGYVPGRRGEGGGQHGPRSRCWVLRLYYIATEPPTHKDCSKCFLGQRVRFASVNLCIRHLWTTFVALLMSGGSNQRGYGERHWGRRARTSKEDLCLH